MDSLPIPDNAKTWNVKDEGVDSVVWQVPNTYSITHLQFAQPGMARKIARTLRSRLSFRDEVERRRKFLFDKRAKVGRVLTDIAIELGVTELRGKGTLYRFLRLGKAKGQPPQRSWPFATRVTQREERETEKQYTPLCNNAADASVHEYSTDVPFV